jgi:hypothetical protein
MVQAVYAPFNRISENLMEAISLVRARAARVLLQTAPRSAHL